MTEALGQLGPRSDGPPPPGSWDDGWPAAMADDLDARAAGVFAPSRTPNEARRGGPRPPRTTGRSPNGDVGQPNRDRPPDPPGADLTAPFSARRPPSSFPPADPAPFGPGGLAAPDDLADARFFGPPPSGGLGQPSSLADDVDLLAPGVRNDLGGYDDSDSFGGVSYLRHEPTPALLAAKAEPLGDPTPSRRTPRAKPAGKSAKSARPVKSAGKTGGKASGSRSTRPGDLSDGPRSAKARAQTQAQRPAKRKPKEPSKVLLAVGALSVILIGVAAGYWLTNRNKTDDPTVAGPTASTAAPGDAGSGAAGDPAATGSTVVTAAAPAGTKPVVMFNEAAGGPVASNTPFTIAVRDAPADAATYLLKVDEQPVGAPAAQLAPYTFTPGRHLLQIEITGPSGTTATDPVVVYALGDVPGRTYRANLSSVSITEEGWAVAVQKFDAFYAAGHTNVKLMPSDGYAGLKPGYWNIFVDGFPDAAAAEAYCTQFGLTIPAQCFSKLFDPAAPAAGG